MTLGNIKHNKPIKIILITTAIIGTLTVVYSVSQFKTPKIYKGITIENIDVSGLNKMDAKNKLDAGIIQNYSDKKLILKYNDQLWVHNLKDVSLKLKTGEAVLAAHGMGRKGNVISRFKDIMTLKFHNRNIEVRRDFDMNKLEKLLESIKGKINRKEKSASIQYKNGKIEVENEIIGRQLKVDKNIKLIENQIVEGNFDTINLDVDEIVPAIRYNDIKGINSVISSFSTIFNPNDSNRTQNLRLSCDRINGVILYPGEIFTMNGVLGPRTVENGYQEAKIIYKNEYVNGVGGGVCQITTTLYDAVLKAKLKVVERSHHSLPSIYAGPGQDATIAEDYIDFKFQNDRSYPVCISAELYKNTIKIRILGKKEENDDYIVKLVPKILEEYPPDNEEVIIDNSIPDNQEVIVQKPKNGFHVILYRETYNKKGQLIDKEKISDDIYKPIKSQIKVNQYNIKAINAKIKDIKS